MGTSDISPLAVIDARLPDRAIGAGTPPAGDRDLLAALVRLRPAGGDAGAVLDALAPLVREAFGGHVVDVALCDARAARLVGAAVAHGPLADLTRRWRRDPVRLPERAGDLAVVPLTDGDRLVGALRLRTRGPAGDWPLALLGARVGEVLARLVENARRASADAASEGRAHRERVARELHSAVTRTLAPAAPALDDLAAMALPPRAAERVAAARHAVARATSEAQAAGSLSGVIASLIARALDAVPPWLLLETLERVRGFLPG